MKLSTFDKKLLFVLIEVSSSTLPAKAFQKVEPNHCLSTWN